MRRDLKDLFISLGIIFFILSPFIYLFVVDIYDSLPKEKIIKNTVNKSKAPAFIQGDVLWVYIEPENYDYCGNGICQNCIAPPLLNWGHGIYTKKIFQEGHWVSYNLPNEKCWIPAPFPRINGKELDLPSRQEYLLEFKYSER